MEAKIAAAKGLPFAGISAGKFRRRHGVGKVRALLDPTTIIPNARDAGRALHGLILSYQLLRSFKPDVVFVMSFVGLPVGVAAHAQKIPLVIHELDFTLNLTNRTLGRWADAVAVGFPVEGYKESPPAGLVFTGNPVREEILKATRQEGLESFGLRPELPVILVTGGSQGAQSINSTVLAALPALLVRAQVIHLTGEQDIERVRFATRALDGESKERYKPFAFLTSTMAAALAVSDIVITRAGANSITELAALHKAAIIIPNYLHAGHQEANGRVLKKAGAARVLNERTLTPEQLVKQVDDLLSSPEKRERMGKALGRFAIPDAPERLARLILETAAAGGRHA